MRTRRRIGLFLVLCGMGIWAGAVAADVVLASASCSLFFNCTGTFQGIFVGGPYHNLPCNECELYPAETINRCVTDITSCVELSKGLKACPGETDETGVVYNCKVNISQCNP